MGKTEVKKGRCPVCGQRLILDLNIFVQSGKSLFDCVSGHLVCYDYVHGGYKELKKPEKPKSNMV